MKSIAEARIKRVRALELVAEGMSYDQVAKEIGYSHRGSAHRAVFKALEEREVEDVATLRALEVARLDHMLSVLWPKIEESDVDAILAAVKICDRRIKLLGLDLNRPSRESEKDFMSLVVGPVDGNPEKATLDDIRCWSAAARAAAPVAPVAPVSQV